MLKATASFYPHVAKINQMHNLSDDSQLQAHLLALSTTFSDLL